MTNVKVTVFWNMTPYTLVICYRRFRSACHLFSSPVAVTSVLNLCSWSSIVEWPTIAPWLYSFVVNRRRRGTLIRNNVQQHDLSTRFHNINKIDFNLTADSWDGKVFLDELEWGFESPVKSQSLQGIAAMTQPASLLCVHPASAVGRRPSTSKRPLERDRLGTTACPHNCV